MVGSSAESGKGSEGGVRAGHNVVLRHFWEDGRPYGPAHVVRSPLHCTNTILKDADGLYYIVPLNGRIEISGE
jgi:hypothetical protein